MYLGISDLFTAINGRSCIVFYSAAVDLYTNGCPVVFCQPDSPDITIPTPPTLPY